MSICVYSSAFDHTHVSMSVHFGEGLLFDRVRSRMLVPCCMFRSPAYLSLPALVGDDVGAPDHLALGRFRSHGSSCGGVENG